MNHSNNKLYTYDIYHMIDIHSIIGWFTIGITNNKLF